ncbi:unnamed protein product [Symbiodinium necroappetens]|uniref:Uncharacterized protein n=1 Tax=Symbiodinium necroappetens TaxID=1628268 RepID=A0A813CEU6_9DINO|nr:unnamed protein product [Symbiodinium necroappetens]
MAMEDSFKRGDDVLVFYRMCKRCRPDRKYLAVLDPKHGAFRPRTGISDGWVPARAMADQQPNVHGGDVEVEYSWPHFYTQRGHIADSGTGWTEWFAPQYVKRPTGRGSKPSLVDAASEPDLAILTFRWGGLNEIIAPAQWGETGSSVSDIFIDAYCDHFQQYLKTGYEVWTVYIEDKSDMMKIADAAHLIFGSHHPMRRAKKVCAMYHLYPTGFEEHCVPNSETGGDGGAALVDQQAFYQMMQAVERAGIPSRFPHDSGFYEILTSKRWTYYMALVPHLNLPATVALPRMLIEQNGGSCAKAANWAYEALDKVRQKQRSLRGEAPTEGGPLCKGVAKLGFSWEALDVKYWEGKAGLQTAISQLTQAIEISDEYTGQPHNLEALIIQEFVEHDMELRLYVVNGEVEATIYTKFCKIKPNNEFGDFKEHFTLEEAAEWMGGDVATLKDGERQCREITAHWMDWVSMQTSQTPPGIRFDYFVGRTGEPGKAKVRTLEICELGFSMLGKKDLPAKVFTAMLHACMEVDDLKEQPEVEVLATNPVREAKAFQKPLVPGQVKSASGAPEKLFVLVPRVPHGTSDQSKCTGPYDLVTGTTPNGQPLWINERGDRFLYAGNDGYWYIGDEEEQDANFNCNSGYIRHIGAGGKTPDQLGGPWERGPDWGSEPEIRVATDPEALHSPPSKGRNKGK